MKEENNNKENVENINNEPTESDYREWKLKLKEVKKYKPFIKKNISIILGIFLIHLFIFHTRYGIENWLVNILGSLVHTAFLD